jgi:phosphoribosylformylglycinamidine synthase subunit PurL
VTEQYDRYVQGNTVLAQPEDAGVVRIDETSNLRHRAGHWTATPGSPGWTPTPVRSSNLAEAYRNVAVSGAVPLAVTNCLNFGSPEEPDVMWQFAEAVRGLADGCRALGLPVTGGNVSLYNQTGDVPINPTPVIGVLGVHADVRQRVRGGWTTAGETLLLLGESRPEFGGSAWASVVHGHLGGLPPRLDLDAERALGGLLASLAADGLVSSAHDLSDGGLAQALTESTLRYGVGATVSVDGDPTAALFGESVARAVVTTADAAAVLAAAQAAGVPVTELGTTGGEALVVEGLLELPLDELHTAWSTTLPTLFDTPEAVVGSVPAGAVPTS